MLTGNIKRQERDWNHTRHIMAYILNYAGMGGPETFIGPKDIWPLSIDKEDEKRMITNMLQAKELLKEFKEAWQG